MIEDISGGSSWAFLTSTVASTTILGLIIFLLRDTIKSYLVKSVESSFAKELEELKSRLKRDEENHANIRNFLTTLRSDRDLLIQRRKMEAAETLIKLKDKIQTLGMLVELSKVLKFDVIDTSMRPEEKASFFKTIIDPYDIKNFFAEYNAIDKNLCYLYLNDNTLKHFQVFSSLSSLAAMNIFYHSLGLKNKESFIDPAGVRKDLIEIIPSASDGLTKFGDVHAYYWVNYLGKRVLELIREEVLGDSDLEKRAKSVSDISVAANLAHMQMTEVIKNLTVPSEYLRNQSEINIGMTEGCN